MCIKVNISMIRALCFIAFIFLMVCAPGCGKNSSGGDLKKEKQRLSVFVSITPVKYLLEEIGGENVEVEVLLPPGRDLHVFEPTGKQILKLSESDIFFTVGLPFEHHVESKIPRGKKIVDLTQGVTFRNFTGHSCSSGHDDHADHDDHANHDDHADHDDHAEHTGSGAFDPHIWLGPAQLEVMAHTVFSALIAHDHASQDYYQQRYDSFIKKLHDTASYCSQKLKAKRGGVVMVFHPSFGYFFDHFDLTQRAIEVDGKSPSAKQIMTMIMEAKKLQITTLFVQPQFDKASATAIARALNGTVRPLDPLAEDVLGNFREMADAISDN